MEIKIKNKTLKYPIIQGGMGVGISLGELSGNVAKNGAMGTISAVGIGYKEDDFYETPFIANKRALKKEIKKAREISKGNGLIGVNVMVAVEDFEGLVKTASEEKVDFIISGAGLPLRLPELVSEDILIAPIVSGVRSLKVIMRYWGSKYDRKPDFLVLEGPNAGGHLGFKKAELEKRKTLEDLTVELISYLDKEELNIPVFVAGSVFDGYDLKKYKELGASGVQIGTRFIGTEECDVDEKFKELIIESTEADLKIIESPVGMPARAIYNDFLREAEEKQLKSKRCLRCLKTCNPQTTQYCIMERLVASAKGEVNEGLVFAGSNIDRINEMTTVKKIIDDIIGEYRE